MIRMTIIHLLKLYIHYNYNYTWLLLCIYNYYFLNFQPPEVVSRWRDSSLNDLVFDKLDMDPL